jgi:hypothetical protein
VVVDRLLRWAANDPSSSPSSFHWSSFLHVSRPPVGSMPSTGPAEGDVSACFLYAAAQGSPHRGYAYDVGHAARSSTCECALPRAAGACVRHFESLTWG